MVPDYLSESHGLISVPMRGRSDRRAEENSTWGDATRSQGAPQPLEARGAKDGLSPGASSRNKAPAMPRVLPNEPHCRHRPLQPL